MKHLLIYILLVIVMVGCSSAPKLSGSQKIPAAQRSFASDIDAVSVENISETQCPSLDVISKELKWKKLLEYGNGCVGKGNWLAVEATGEQLNRIEPDSPWGAYYLSLSAESKGQVERAYWMIELAIKKSDKVGLLHYQKGRLLWNLSYFKDSLSEIEKSIELDRSIKDAYVFLGQAYLKQLKFKESLRYFQQALNLESKNRESLQGIVHCFIELENDKEALAYSQSAISKYPRAIDFRLHEAFIYENMKQQKDIALLKYKDIKTLYSSKKIDGTLPHDFDLKIKELEVLVEKSTRKLAGK